MTELSPLIRLFSFLFLVTVMLSIGLDVTWRQVAEAFGRLGLMGRALVANIVLVPLLAFILVRIFPLSPDVAAGILILGAAPGAPFAVQFTSKVRDARALAAALLFVLTVVSVIVTPPLAGFLMREDTPLVLPVWRVARGVVAYLLLPLLAGFALQRWAPTVAQWLLRPATLCAAVSFPVVIVLTLGMKSAATRAMGAPALGAMLALILGGMLIGWLLGGPERGTRQVLAASTSMRSAMVGLLVAETSFPDSDVGLAVLAFSALMVPPNLILTLYQNWQVRRAGA